MGNEELKQMLEDSAKEIHIKGEVAELKSADQKESEKDFEEWENKKFEQIVENPKTKLYQEYLRLVLEGNIHSLICVSKAGYGKTHTTINILKKMKKKFVYQSGYTTPLSFYTFLFEHKDSTIILDDLTDDVFKNKKMVAILKSCLYEAGGDRFVSYETTSDKLSVPSKFKFNGKIILLANEVGSSEKEDFNALISRCIFFELKYSFAEVLEISNRILESKNLDDKVKSKVIEIMKKNVNEVSQFNFRQLEQLIEMVNYNPKKAELLFCNSFKKDSTLSLVCELMKLPISVREQALKFNEQTGFSTRKYYRLKARIKDGM